MKARKVQHLSTEHLSAYLDGQVTPEERQQVESHLRTCPQCAGELESLRHTVSLLHQVRQVAVPRPLTLREMDVRPARAPQRAWLLPYLQGATALVSLLLVALVAGDLLLGLGGAPTARPAALVVATVPVEAALPPERAAEEATPEVALAHAPVAAEVATEEALAATALPTAEVGLKAAEEGEAIPSGEAVPGFAAEETATPFPAMRALNETMTPPPMPWPPGDMGGIGGPGEVPTEAEPISALAAETPTPSPTPTAAPSPTPTPLPPTVVAMAPEVVAATPEAAPLAAVVTPSPVPFPAPAQEAARAAPVPWVRLAEIGLLGAALLLGGLTLLLRHR